MIWGKNKKTESMHSQEFLSVINNLTDGLLVFDRNSTLTLINPKAGKILNIKEKDVLGENILSLSSFPRAEKMVSALGGGVKEVSEKEIELEENFIIEVDSIKVGNQENVGTLVVLRDISREKKVERMKTEFVTLAAHQLRTPMAGIKWSLRMVLDEETGKLNQRQKEVLEKAYYTNNKVIDLINDLLNVARIEEGKYISKKELSDIEKLVEEVVNKRARQMEEKNLTCKIKKPKEKLPKVMMDREKMKIAFANILENSIFYTLEGGKITISLEKEDKKIRVSVSDTGLGIPAVAQDRVFEKFFRSKNVMRVETEGTGLGLYITKNIIKSHGGRIWFESKEGKGTTFLFTLPIKKEFGEFLSSEFY